MKKSKPVGLPILFVALSFYLLSMIVLAIIASKIENIKLRNFALASIVFQGVCLVFSTDSNKDFSDNMGGGFVFVWLVGLILVFVFLGEYRRAYVIKAEMKRYGISPEKIDVERFKSEINNYDADYTKTAKKMYGTYGEMVLKALSYHDRCARGIMPPERPQQRDVGGGSKITYGTDRRAVEEMERIRWETEMERKGLEEERRKLEYEKNNISMQASTLSRQKEEPERAPRQEQPVLDHKIDINTCSEKELAMVPGVGVVSAKRAVTERSKNGPFSSVSDFIDRASIKSHKASEIDRYLICNNADDTDRDAKRGRIVDV